MVRRSGIGLDRRDHRRGQRLARLEPGGLPVVDRAGEVVPGRPRRQTEGVRAGERRVDRAAVALPEDHPGEYLLVPAQPEGEAEPWVGDARAPVGEGADVEVDEATGF